MDKVRIGIIGYGGMGAAHSEYLKAGEVRNAELTAVCDTRPERLEHARRKLGEAVRLFEQPGELFASGTVDGILIATPHYDHPPLAIQAFQKSLHVLSEKPAGVYTRQVREMNAAAQANGKVFGLMFQQRTIATHRKLKELVEAGELGALQRTNYILTNWFRSQAYYDSGGWRATWAGEGGGVLLNQCPHNLDIWQWIAGLPKRLRAFCYFGKYHRIEVEDEVTAFVEYENGATGLFVTSTGEAPGTNRLELVGDRGKVVLEGGQITFWRTRMPVSQYLRESKEMFKAPETWRCEVPPGESSDGHKWITQDWVNAILHGTPLLAPGADGIRSLELSNAMLLSTWLNDWVELPINEDLFHAKLQEQIKASQAKKVVKERTADFAGTY